MTKMIVQTQGWTGAWVLRKMRALEDVISVRELGPQHIEVVRKHYGGLVVGTLACEEVNAAQVRSLITGKPSVGFIVNVPKESYVTGDALRLGTAAQVPIGGLRDLMSAVSLSDVSRYKSKETEFLERGLEQHSRVSSFERVHDRKYSVERRELPEVTVVFLNEYELTVDHVRTARSRYGSFDMIVVTNPYGNCTSFAINVAETMDVPIYKWGQFLGALNRP